MDPNKIDRQTFRALVLLSIAYFVQATTALCVVGGFASISSEWRLTTTESAMLVSAFGATFAVTAPLLQMLVGHWIRRTQILAGLSVMAFGAVGFALAPSSPVLFAARIVMGLGAALISPILAALGSSMVKPAQQGAALATILMGLGISAVIGVPSSAWIALHVGPRWMFASIAGLTLITAMSIVVFIRDRSPGERVSPKQVVALVQRPATIGALLTAFFITAGIFSTYTMISPIMHDRYDAGPHLISIAFLVYGVSGLVGNLFVRRISAAFSAEILLRSAVVTLIVIFTGLLILPLSLTVLLAALVAWPFVLDVFWPSQQRRIVELEPALRGLALAVTASFLFTGIAAGSALGGAFYPKFGLSSVLMTSIVLLLIGLGTLSFSVRAMKPKPAGTTPAGISKSRGTNEDGTCLANTCADRAWS